ncbi:MAG: SDR family oxidoreductase [Burkholderiaceae bacterium]
MDDVGNVAAFLLSDLSARITGEITYVDGGFRNVSGIAALADRHRPTRPISRAGDRSRAEEGIRPVRLVEVAKAPVDQRAWRGERTDR